MLLISLCGCEWNYEKEQIGFIGTLTGSYSDLGQESLKGVLLAMDKTGASKNAELLIRDDEGMPGQAEQGMNELRAAGVRYVIGPNISTVAAHIIPYAIKNNMYLLSPTASSSTLTGTDNHFMRVIPPNSTAQMEKISNYLISKLNIHDMVIIYDKNNSVYTKDVVKNFAEAYMSRGGVIRDMRAIRGRDNDSLYDLVAGDLKNPPSMYYIVASVRDTSMMLWQIKKTGLKSKTLIRPWAESKDFFNYSGSAAEGAYLFSYYSQPDTKEFKTFQQDYYNKYKIMPTWVSLYGYESGLLLIKSMPKMHNGDNFYNAVATSAKYAAGLSGVTFDSAGDGVLQLKAYILRNGKPQSLGVLK